jgi:hypothetical protein
VPWPFDDPARKQAVEEFVKAAFRTDALKPTDRPRCRLSDNELERLRESRDAAERLGGWAWYGYGRTVYQLAQAHPTLPEPPDGKPVTDTKDLWPDAQKHYDKKGPRLKVLSHVGRWPDFALAVHDDARASKQVPQPREYQFGPARPGEFKEPVRQAVGVLEKKATPAEWKELQRLEGRWPEYPRELVRLARVHDLEIPGVTLPGQPSRWEQVYNPPKPGSKPGG